MTDKTDEPGPETEVKCVGCGVVIGNYISATPPLDGRPPYVCIRVGGAVLRMASGWCAQCGADWHWRASDKTMERLMSRRERMLEAGE